MLSPLKKRFLTAYRTLQNKGANPMSENRKYYYLKLKENFFTSEKMVILH